MGNIMVDQTIDGGNGRKLRMFTNVSKLLVTIGAFVAQRKKRLIFNRQLDDRSCFRERIAEIVELSSKTAC